jgi:hypothetical protein
MSKSGNASGAPGVGTMTDTLELMKNMWSGMKLPGMVMPTMSVDDINKQIADLKAVESWLAMNMNMLRGTIQALEVQSATLATLQAMSANMNSMMQGAAQDAKDKAAAPPPFSFQPPAADNQPPNQEQSAEGAPYEKPADVGTGAAAVTPPFANPAIWWNMLQDQFQQAVNAATAPEQNAAAEKAGPSSKRKSPKTS